MEQFQEMLAEISQLVQANSALCAGAGLCVMLICVLLFTSKPTKTFLSPQSFQDVMLADKRQLTHNTVYLRFALPDKRMKLGLPIGQHIVFLMKDADGKDVYRNYTPVSDDSLLGFVDFVIKVYPEGKMTQILDKLNLGDTVAFKGPRGRFKYQPNTKRVLGMIAGGTGITPMYQVAKAIFKNKADKTQVRLIFGSITEDDILIRDELERLVQDNPGRFKIIYVLNKPPAGWTGGSGFITEDMIQQHLPAPAEDVMVLRCGPPAMNTAMAKHLNALGYTADMQFEF